MEITLGLLSPSPANNAAGDADGSSSEVTSSYPENLELGLGLGLGLSIGGKSNKSWNQYARILTAKDFQVSKNSNNCCSSSNSSNSGVKRSANDSVSVSPPNGTSVVGWPPVSKAHRMPSSANQAKSPTENLITEHNKSKNRTVGINDYSSERKLISNKKYQSVKVNLDGTPIGRKVDLNAHSSYEMLAHTLEEMFWGRRSSTEAVGHSRLLDGTSEYVLTYEDKDGDYMLVGDVPWQMFLSSVKRLRIIRNFESNELSRKQQETQN